MGEWGGRGGRDGVSLDASAAAVLHLVLKEKRLAAFYVRMVVGVDSGCCLVVMVVVSINLVGSPGGGDFMRIICTCILVVIVVMEGRKGIENRLGVVVI